MKLSPFIAFRLSPVDSSLLSSSSPLLSATLFPTIFSSLYSLCSLSGFMHECACKVSALLHACPLVDHNAFLSPTSFSLSLCSIVTVCKTNDPFYRAHSTQSHTER
mmetsp:Transcript_4874/g.10312  ORF Transcript_4874/g.10312 Transcript_4874/m.10312 type:complete len:106 (-) Transcript_4874:379-696(-)